VLRCTTIGLSWPNLARLAAISKDEILWYYGALVGAFMANPAHDVALVDELDRTVQQMRRLADEAGLAAAQ
jgi:hypothetical protein